MKTNFGATQFYQGFRDAGADVSALAEIPWPSLKNDAWRYTSLSALAERRFVPVSRLEGVLSPSARELFLPGAANLVFVNGLLAEHLSEMDKLDPSWKIVRGSEEVRTRDHSAGAGKEEGSLFRALNQALSFDGLSIIVPGGAKSIRPLHVISLFEGTASRQAVFPRISLQLGPGAEAAFWETAAAFDEGEYLYVPVFDAVLGEGASLEHAQAMTHSAAAFHLGSVRVRQGRDSRYHSFVFTGGARVFRHDVGVFLNGEGAEARLDGLHALKDDRHADSHTMIDHGSPNTRSEQLYKGILRGRAHSVFCGKIDVRREAQLTNAYQLNKSLLLDRECRVDARPQLEIHADDVKCTHGATVGQLNDEELFYLQTRGVDKEEARRMLVHGFVDDVLNRVSSDIFRSAIGKMAAL